MKNILIVIDVQKEITTPNRLYFLDGIDESLKNAKHALEFARGNGWDIVHIQHSNGASAERFKLDSEYFDFVDGFEPVEGEMHFVKNDYSCYSNEEFVKYMDESVTDDTSTYIIGYNSVMCCLSTLEEARRRNHKINYIHDASLARAINDMSEIDTHKFMVSLYKAKGLANIISLSDLTKNEAYNQ